MSGAAVQNANRRALNTFWKLIPAYYLHLVYCDHVIKKVTLILILSSTISYSIFNVTSSSLFCQWWKFCKWWRSISKTLSYSLSLCFLKFSDFLHTAYNCNLLFNVVFHLLALWGILEVFHTTNRLFTFICGLPFILLIAYSSINNILS